MVDNQTQVVSYFEDGASIGKGDLIAEISGKVVSILKSERTALNFLSMLSAVATRTSAFVKESRGLVTVLDTRKTIPGFRQLQKYAVRCGGGSNHRMGLYDMVMIKDNHIDAAGGIKAAVGIIRDQWGERYKIEVETRNIGEVREALACGVDRIMLDNMSDIETMEAVRLINGKCETEASGNMTLGRIRKVATTGVNFISIGEITHSIKAFDFSLKVK
jgi:nicotinate-nucleotide pyrophosphorylase (carboxylating)